MAEKESEKYDVALATRNFEIELFWKMSLLLCISIVLGGCGVTLSELQSQTSTQRANTVCVYASNYIQAKSKYDQARLQANRWKTDAGNGYTTKRQCQYAQEPYSDSENRCTTDVFGYRNCEYITVTKYRSVQRCTNVYVPINTQVAYEYANRWKRDAEKYKITMNSAWNNCYSWAVYASPQQLHNWLNNK